MNSVYLSDQLQNVYRVDHWMRKYEWFWYLLFLGHDLVLANAYIFYKTLCEEGKLDNMNHYEFLRLLCLEHIDPTNFGSCDHLVSAVPKRCIIKKDGSISNTNVSVRS